MAQFDVYRNPNGGTYPLLLDIQADLLIQLPTRAVVPMVAREHYTSRPMTRLNPTATIGRKEYVLLFQELAAITRDELGPKVSSLGARRSELVTALDLLFTGI